MKAIMLMAYGSPRTMEEVEDYYTHVRGGRKPAEAQLNALKARYAAIGGGSPLLRITEEQAAALQALLESRGSRTKVYAAMKHSHPFIVEKMRQVEEDRIDELLCIVLAPHYSHMSIGGYAKAIDEATARGELKTDLVKSWHTNPMLISGWVDLIRSREARSDGTPWLIFTAHSLPERILREGDPYKDQLLETASLIAKKLGRTEWSYAFQSASQTGEPWLGPDIIDHLEYLKGVGRTRFLIAPIGFVADHLEILYDIDVECVRWANQNGVTLTRCDSFNSSKALIECLFSIAEEKRFVD